METTTPGNHQSTYDALFQHPIARNLQWRDVRSMLSAMSDSTEEHDDHLKFTRNGHSLTIHPPKRKDFSDVQGLMRVRHFLELSGAPPQAAAAPCVHLLVVIDHREARIFETELRGSVPQRVVPYDPHGSHRHLHNVEHDSNGQRKPEPKAFYDAVVRTLNDAETILIFGSSTGSSSAMDFLVARIKQDYPELAKRIVGTAVVNEQHLSEGQLLAKAREIYAATGLQGSVDRV
jgi:hypothetical protein